MIVSVTDIANTATMLLQPTSETQDPSVILNGDYSSVYTDALQGSLKITFTFDDPTDIGYIALSGNFSSKDRLIIKSIDTTQELTLVSSDGFDLFSSDGFELAAENETSIDDSLLSLKESRVMVYRTDIVGSREIEIEVFGTGTIAITQIAMGRYYEIPRGEQAGYKRPWTVPNKIGRTATSLNNSPIALAYESRSIKSSLSVPNNIMADFDGWYEFIDFAVSNTFYGLEDGDKFHSFAGFNTMPMETAAHSQTRDLGVSSVSYNAYSKASGVFFV